MRGVRGLAITTEGCIAPSRAPSTGYFTDGCRCARCKGWASAYFRERNANKRRWRARIESVEPGDRQAICNHARTIAQRMIADGVPDAAAVGIALEHMAEMLKNGGPHER